VSRRRFARYALVGLGNTAIHWLAFFVLHQAIGWSQASSNAVAFGLAASLSYLVNARVTFEVAPKTKGYVLFMSGMGALSLLIGWAADHSAWSPWLTVSVFSAISLIAGYAYANTVVFRRSVR
jgi:putative flippase GtrA